MNGELEQKDSPQDPALVSDEYQVDQPQVPAPDQALAPDPVTSGPPKRKPHRQHGVLQYSFKLIFKVLKELGANSPLFSVEDGCIINTVKSGTKVFVGISDICQLSQDRNGEKVVVKDKTYEAPTRMGLVLSITAVSKSYPNVLETLSCIAAHFKDNYAFPLGEFNWHDNPGTMLFIEPVVRPNMTGRSRNCNDLPSLTLEYMLEVGINAEKGIGFKRVEQRTFIGKNIQT
jgi:hypothetical protein